MRHLSHGPGEPRARGGLSVTSIDPFAAVQPPELAAAARAVVADAPRDARSDVQGEVTALLQALDASAGSAPPPAGARPAIRRARLHQLRAALLDQWARTPPEQHGAMVALLQRFDALDPARPRARAEALLGSGGLETAAEIAHDFRSPIGSVLMLADMLQKGQSGPITALQRRQLAIIYGAAMALSSFAEDIIELVRGGRGLVEPEPRPFSLTDLVLSLRDLVQPLADGKDLELRMSSDAADLRFGYPLVLRRVLLNLTTNALKYTDSGWVELTIIPLEGDWVRFDVRDSGRGLPADVLARIRASSGEAPAEVAPGTRRVSSSALGLGICMNLLATIGSELCVETQPEAGSRFHFEVELAGYEVEKAQPGTRTA